MADDKPTPGEGEQGQAPVAPEGAPVGDEVPAGEEGEISYEPSADGMLLTEENMAKLEEQLKQMEEEQNQLAAKIQAANQAQKLDDHLAELDEQFRRSFEDRISAPAARGGRPTSFISHFDTGAGVDIDLIKLNGIFRDVSRDLGDEWKPVFTDLTKNVPEDVVKAELEKIEQMQPLVRGYRSLNVWKELAGPEFNIKDLVDALRKNNQNELADATSAMIEGTAEVTDSKSKPVARRKSEVTRGRSVLDNRRMLLLAKKIGGDWEGLGKALGLPDEELAEIKEDPDSSTYQGAFKMLWAWRQTQPDIEQESSVEALKSALKQTNRQTLADELTSL